MPWITWIVAHGRLLTAAASGAWSWCWCGRSADVQCYQRPWTRKYFIFIGNTSEHKCMRMKKNIRKNGQAMSSRHWIVNWGYYGYCPPGAFLQEPWNIIGTWQPIVIWKGVYISTTATATVNPRIAIDRLLFRDWDKHVLCGNQLLQEEKSIGYVVFRLIFEFVWGLCSIVIADSKED